MNLPVKMKSLHPRYRDFQAQLDVAFDKSNPAKSIPWPKLPPPKWAEQFRPKAIVDIGCATGKFTSAILDRLGLWGCLADLESLVLIEEERGFDSTDTNAIADTIARCRGVIGQYTERNVRIDAINRAAEIGEPVAGGIQDARISVGVDELPAANLLIASHVTYYFPDGGTSLLRALANSLTANGLAWVVVRKHDCPLYRERSRVMPGGAAEGRDYAEDIGAAIPSIRDIEPVDERDWGYLDFGERPSDCVPLAHLLMWRETLNQDNPSSRTHAAQVACDAAEPLFSERHFIVRSTAST